MLLRVFADITGLIDDKGRRLHEVAFRSEQDKDDFKVCKFSGSRYGKLMNQSAFQDIFSSWNETLATQHLFRELFLCDGKPEYSGLGEIWQISLLPLFSPLYWKLSLTDSASSFLPSPVAGLHKIALGVPSVIELMILMNEVDGKESPENQIHEPHIFAEEHGLLINEAYACAGPANMMREFEKTLKGEFGRNLSGYIISFREDFMNPQYAIFSFLMTCQYVCGRFFWLYDILMMERAFSALAANGAYNTHLQHPETESLTTPESRRRLILSILIEKDYILENLSHCYTGFLRESGRLTGLPDIIDVVVDYLEFLHSGFKSINIHSPISILALHDQFRAGLCKAVEPIRKQLRIVMKLEDMHEIPEFSMFFPGPADELRSILSSETNM